MARTLRITMPGHEEKVKETKPAYVSQAPVIPENAKVFRKSQAPRAEYLRLSPPVHREEAKLGTWFYLPPEMRNQILEYVSENFRPSNTSTTKRHESKKINPRFFTGCATVSSEWQAWFERDTFREITVHHRPKPNLRPGLGLFEEYICSKKKYRLPFVRNIKFNIVLDYQQPGHADFLGRYGAEINNDVFTDAMVRLLSILADLPKGSVTLELCIWHVSEALGWETDSFDGATKRLGRLLEWTTDEPLHYVPAVNGVVIQKGCNQHLSPRSLARLFTESLNNTEWFIMDRLCRMCPGQTELDYMRDFKEVLVPSLPKSLRKFLFHSSFYAENLLQHLGPYYMDTSALHIECSSFYDSLARLQCSLTELSYSHPALAWPCEGGQPFVHTAMPTPWQGMIALHAVVHLNRARVAGNEHLRKARMKGLPFDKTRRTELANQHLHEIQNFSPIPRLSWDSDVFKDLETIDLRAPLVWGAEFHFLNDILQSAAWMAASMPKLRYMCIRHQTGLLKVDAAFIYVAKSGSQKPGIEFRSHSRSGAISDETVLAWKTAAEVHAGEKTELEVKDRRIFSYESREWEWEIPDMDGKWWDCGRYVAWPQFEDCQYLGVDW